MSISFYEWIWESIDWYGIPRVRAACIREFVKDGLIPAVKNAGYEFSIGESKLANFIANYLFDRRGNSCLHETWNYKFTNWDWSLEEKSHFHFVLGPEFWGQFWNQWGGWEEVSLNSERGQDRRIDIQEFIWNYMNLDVSQQTQELDELMRGGEEDDDYNRPTQSRKQGNDAYIQDGDLYSMNGYRRRH